MLDLSVPIRVYGELHVFFEETGKSRKTSEVEEGVKRYVAYFESWAHSMLMFSLVQAFSFILKVPRFCIFLMSWGRWFHVEADLTMNDLLVVDFSTAGTNRVPLVELLVLDGMSLLLI